MKKILLSLVVLVGSFSITAAAGVCHYGFLTSCGTSHYVAAECGLPDSILIDLMDYYEDSNCNKTQIDFFI